MKPCKKVEFFMSQNKGKNGVQKRTSFLFAKPKKNKAFENFLCSVFRQREQSAWRTSSMNGVFL